MASESTPVDAVVVGSGPNGLAAAAVLARNGLSVRVHEAEPGIGGGVRSAELTLPGFIHDLCSAIHPLAPDSPVFSSLPLGEHGLEWIYPDVDVAHPLDDGTAVVLVRSLEESAAGLAEDAGSYRRMIEPLATRSGDLFGDVLQPLTRVPRHPLLLGRFGLRAMLPVSTLCRAFKGERARALFAGLAAHSFLPLDAKFTGSFALIFAVTAHAVGWPFPKGGSQRLADALGAVVRAAGGEIRTGDRIEAFEQLGRARAYLFDTSPWALERIAADRLPGRYRGALRRFRRGPGIFKIDYALSGPVPWRAAECRRAGTVHLGGTFAEVAQSEAEVAHGRHPEHPFVLVAQQSLFDSTRAPPGKHTLWVYCHVPNGSTLDMTARVEAQIERFAPGFKDLVLARAVTTSAEIETRNANCVGGDIGGGAYDGLQLLARPVLSIDPYATPAKELYLCSSSTPPGAGVHGMCGANAARSALRRSFGVRGPPLRSA